MIRRPRLAAPLLALALVAVLLPTTASSAQSGTPLRAEVRDTADPAPPVVLRGRGWGHSVGLSQYGAFAQARAGRSHSQILQHYYPGVVERTWSADSQQRVSVRAITGTAAAATTTALGGDVAWLVCPVGGDCRPETQPEGETWSLVSGGSDQPYRVTLCTTELQASTGTPRPTCPDADQAYQGNGTVQARLTSRDQEAAAGERLEIGSRQYAYGWITARGITGDLRLDNDLALENYLRGLGEVPSSWGGSGGGQHALEAQAIIARTYVLGRNRDTCATAACQVFVGYTKELEATGGNWVAAVTGTRGRYLRTPDGDGIAQTYYSSSHGGRTEASEDSWAYGGAVPYLVSVDDPWSIDAANPMRSWTAVATNAEFRRVTGLGLSRIQQVEIASRTAGGSPRVLRVTGPEGTREFSTTAPAAESRSCNRDGYAGNSLRCDLSTTVRNAAGEPFAGAGGKPPSSQIRSFGFAPFTDDDGGTHEYATVWAYAAGIAEGKDATTFAPRQRVTRAQMASFLYRTFDVPERTDHDFADVTGGPHAEAIASVAAAGIARGYEDGRFRPGDPVTREQMASFLARAMGLSPVTPDFADVPPGGTHAGSIGAIAEREITAGCRPGRFCPSDPVTRDQMTTFLHRAVRSLR